MTVYAKMTGFGTSTIRAVTMFLVMVVDDSLRKSYDLPTSFVLSAFTMVLLIHMRSLLYAFYFRTVLF